MTIEEMRKAKKKAEQEIMEILSRLCKETGADITATDISSKRYQDAEGRHTMVTGFTITMGLE